MNNRVVTELAAVILAGGRARRLGGIDKATVVIDGRSLLQRTLDAVRAADDVLVVGSRSVDDSGGQTRWITEDPPGSGPLAGIHAGVDALVGKPRFIAILAVDCPFVGADTVDRLRRRVHDSRASGAVLADTDGRPQWLIGVWRGDALRAALPVDPAEVRNRAVRGVLGDLDPIIEAAVAREAFDVDTEDDLLRVTE